MVYHIQDFFPLVFQGVLYNTAVWCGIINVQKQKFETPASVHNWGHMEQMKVTKWRSKLPHTAPGTSISSIELPQEAIKLYKPTQIELFSHGTDSAATPFSCIHGHIIESSS